MILLKLIHLLFSAALEAAVSGPACRPLRQSFVRFCFSYPSLSPATAFAASTAFAEPITSLWLGRGSARGQHQRATGSSTTFAPSLRSWLISRLSCP